MKICQFQINVVVFEEPKSITQGEKTFYKRIRNNLEFDSKDRIFYDTYFKLNHSYFLEHTICLYSCNYYHNNLSMCYVTHLANFLDIFRSEAPL